MINKNTTFENITAHLLIDEKPSFYLEGLSQKGYLNEPPLSMLQRLRDTKQSPKYHPEGSAWNHTMLVLDEAARVREKSKNKEVFMWSALLHDIGKPATTKVRKGRITSYDHDKVGEGMSREFLLFYDCERRFIDSVAAMVRYHMHMLYVLRKLPYADMTGLLKRVDIYDLALLCLCDRLGRTNADPIEEDKDYKEFLQVLSGLVR